MTPAQDYARKRAEAEALIRQHAPARLQEQLIALLRPAITLTATRTEDAQIPVGASKFGGAPDVPADFEWPLWNDNPLGFLAQINLEEVTAFDVDELLPKSGLLLFFQRVRVWFSADSEHRVEFVSAEALKPAVTPSAFNSKNAWHIPLCRASPLARWVLPDMTMLDVFDASMKEDWDEMGELYEAMANPTEHRLLGYADAVQGSVEYEAEKRATGLRYPQDEEQINRGALQWLPLLQIDSQLNPGYEPKWMFGDAGIIQWMIRRDDLKARRWSETQFIFQCG